MSQATLDASFNISKFLAQDWQKRPRLLPQLVKFDDPLSAEELAGLACEEEVESRLVLGARDWTLRHGPFQESDFTSLAENNWSLLVQSVDIYSNAFKELQSLFTFIPKWRLEDVMVSFAAPGGGVGPHFDYYDVFLVQGSGQRRWRLGGKCQINAKLQKNSGLALLNSFNTEQEVILNAGDVLYIPPQFAHWGEAISDSFCYSIGFRAPSIADMLEGYSEGLIERANPAERFTNELGFSSNDSAEITIKDLNKAYSLLQQKTTNQLAFNKWFGAHMTLPKNPDLFCKLDEVPEYLELQGALIDNRTLMEINSASRMAYANLPQEQTLLFFVDGRVYVLSPSNLNVVSTICNLKYSFKEIFLTLNNNDELIYVALDMLREGSLLLSDPI